MKVYGSLPNDVLPQAPTGLVATNTGAGFVALTWDAPEEGSVGAPTAWQVYVNGAPNGTSVSVPSATVPGLVPDTTYSVQVQAFNVAGSSQLSGVLEVTTLSNSPPYWSLTSQQLYLGVAYVLDLTTVCADVDGQALSFAVVSGAVPGLSLLNNILQGTPTTLGTYQLVLSATDGYTQVNAAADFVVSDPDVTAPTVPGSVVAVANGTAVNVTWTASTDASGVASYKIYRDGALRAEGITDLFYEDDNVPAGTYTYGVRAVDASSNANVSEQGLAAPVTVTVAAIEPPINMVVQVASATSLTISWAPSPNGLAPTGYELEKSTNGVSWAAVAQYSTPALSVTNTGLTTGTLLYYRVRALSGGLASAWATAQGTPIASPVATTFALGLDETYYVAGSTTNGWRDTADTVKGWDWSYPGNTAVAPLSGIFMFTNNSAFPTGMQGKRIYKINADWWELEPTEGNYSGIASKLEPIHTIMRTGTYNSLPWDGVQLDIRGTCYSDGGLTSEAAQVPNLVSAPAWLAAYLPSGAAYRTTSGTRVHFNFAHFEWYSRFRLLIDQIANYTFPAGTKTNGTAFPAYKLPAHPILLGQIVHAGGTGSAGEEAGYGWEGYANTSIAEAAKTVRRWTGRYNRTSVTNADGVAGYQTQDYRYKLEWVGQHSTTTPEFLETKDIIDSGMGSRGGLMERWIEGRKTPRNSVCWVGQALEQYKNSSGSPVAANYYHILDPTDPRITEIRWFGDQNEEWRDIAPADEAQKGWLFVPEKWQLNYRMASISTVARALNNTAMEDKDTGLHGNTPTGSAQYTNHGVEGFVNPSIVRWMSLQLGKRVYNAAENANNETNEAFCCLCRMETRGGYYDPIAPSGYNGGTYANPVNSSNGRSGASILHNWERWLTQREADGSTTHALPVTYGYNPSGDDGALDSTRDEMWQAKTGTAIGFRLDDALRFGTNSAYSTRPVAVKVTFYDNNTEEWTLRYSAASGLKSAATSPKHKNGHGTNGAPSNKVQTTTFFLTDFANISGVNFQIVSNGTTPFMFVRVIRT